MIRSLAPLLISMMEVVIIKQPNSVCKNINCGKLFYACAYCTHTNAWRAVACSIDCYQAYSEQVHEAREKKKNVNLLPVRMDMAEEQVKELMTRPVDEVIAETKEELSDYVDTLNSVGFGGTVDMINEEIRNAEAGNETQIPVRRTRKRKTDE